MIILDADLKCHRITAPKRESTRLLFYINQYLDTEKTIGFSRKKKKYVMKYPRRTYWKKYFMARPHLKRKKKLNKKKR